MRSRRKPLATALLVLAFSILFGVGSVIAGTSTVVTDTVTCTTAEAALPTHRLEPGWIILNTDASKAIYLGTAGIAATAGSFNIVAGQALSQIQLQNSKALHCVVASGTAKLAIYGEVSP